MKTGATWATLALILCATAAGAWAEPSDAGSRIDLSGNLKSFLFAVDPAGIENDPLSEEPSTEGLAQTKLRLRLLAPLSDELKTEVAYEVRPVIEGDIPVLTAGYLSGHQVTSTYRIADLETQLYPENEHEPGSFRVAQNLDRLSATLSTGFADFTCGRQPIAFGAAHVINPTDVLAPYNFNELDTEDRLGVDAVRMRAPLGAMGEIDSGLVFGDDMKRDNSAAFMRLRHPFQATDVTFSAIEFRENLLIGMDATRAVGGAGVWVEAAWTVAGLFDERISGDDYGRASGGIDYNINWRDGVYVYLEYHYNGASADDPAQYFKKTADTAYREGGVYLLGRHYLAPGAAFHLTPLWTANLSALVNLGDDSEYFMAALEYNFFENAYLSFGLNIPRGDRATIAPGPTAGDFMIRPRSEFGCYPTLYYTSISLYF